MAKLGDIINFFVELEEASRREREYQQRQTAFEQQQELYRRQLESIEEERQQRAAMLQAGASGKLGRGKLADLEDAKRAGLRDSAGLYLGAIGRIPLFHNGDGHLLTYGRAGSGKGRDVILPNLAHISKNSVVVIDAKNGENAYASAEHRFRTLQQDVIFLNPWETLGFPNFKINPLQRLIDLTKGGKTFDQEAYEIAMVLVPSKQGARSEDSWVQTGAQELLALRMEYLAYADPDNCTLSGLWRFINSSDTVMDKAFSEMEDYTDHEDIRGRAARLYSVKVQAPKQFEACRDEAATAMKPYKPGGALANSTSSNRFDFSILKQKPCTVYLMVPGDKLDVADKWIALIVSHIIETIAHTRGKIRTTFLLDEFAQLPYMPAIIKSLRLYRGLGIQLWPFVQGRFSLTQRWGEPLVKEFEDQAQILQMWDVEDPSLLKDIEFWSGKTSEIVQNFGVSGGGVGAASFGINEVVRPVLQIEDIRNAGPQKQFIRMPGFPIFKLDRVPWWEVYPWAEQLRNIKDIT